MWSLLLRLLYGRIFVQQPSKQGKRLIKHIFLSFSDAYLWGHWTVLNQTWTHIHLWLLFLFKKFGPNSLGIYPHGWGAKPLFGTDFELWPNRSLQRNMISTIEKKLVSLQGLSYIPQIWWILVRPETAENGWKVPPLKFRIWRHCKL